ncbi:MAG: CPBP family intramembrane glutamic endopeptidase [Propionibacteriaceae bacterium]
MSTPQPTRHPYLIVVGVTTVLIVLLAVVGTACALLGVAGYVPVAVAFVPIAVGLAAWAAVGRRWAGLGFRVPRRSLAAFVVPVVLLVSVGAGIRGFVPSGPAAWLGYVGLALLVGAVEETIFRGVLLRMLLARGRGVAVLVSALSFAVAHSAAAINPAQSAAASLRQIGFAFLFGLLAGLVVLLTDSLWPTIVLHAAFDLLGFVGRQADQLTSDVLVIVVAAMLVGILVVVVRRGGKRTPRHWAGIHTRIAPGARLPQA